MEDTEQDYLEFQEDLRKKDEIIAELEAKMAELAEQKAKLDADEEERRRLEEEARKNKPKPKVKYIPIKGDRIDELMAAYLNNFELDIPFQRLSEGNYLFGTRKIQAKIMNDKLVIRVGGGFMLIDEFLTTYGQQELDKFIAAQNKGNSSFNQGMGSPARRSSPSAQGLWKNIAASGRNSPGANRGSPSAMKVNKM